MTHDAILEANRIGRARRPRRRVRAGRDDGLPRGPSRPLAVEVLPNGLTLIIQDHRAADIVAVYLWVATGVRYESPTVGYAHFQEHMLFKGTDTFGPGYIDRTVEGGRRALQCLHVVRLHDLPDPGAGRGDGTGIELLEDMAFRSTFDPKEIDAERQVIFEETAHRDRHPEVGHPPPALRHGLRRPSLRPARARNAGAR